MSPPLHMETRWVALAGGIVIESIAGSSYAFGIWGPALKAKLNYTQADIETVGSVGNFGENTGELSQGFGWSTLTSSDTLPDLASSAVFAGLVFDAFGPRVTGVVGALLVGIGEALRALVRAAVPRRRCSILPQDTGCCGGTLRLRFTRPSG